MVTPVCTSEPEIHLRFEVWDPTTARYVPLANMAVEVRDDDTVGSDLLDTQNTDAQGYVKFNSCGTYYAQAGDELPDLFFLAKTKGTPGPGGAALTLPDEWSTKSWLSVDGQPGYYEDWKRTNIGTASNPLVFRVGVDIHLVFKYQHKDDSHWEVVPPHVRTYVSFAGHVRYAETNDDGVLHYLLFDVDSDAELTINIEMIPRMEDPAINLMKTVGARCGEWGGKFKLDKSTSIGSPSAPRVVTTSDYDQCLAMWLFKVTREWATFLFHFTRGDWKGVNLEITGNTLIGNSYSWPVGEVHMHTKKHWHRPTIFHEITHQVEWDVVGTDSISVLAHTCLAKHSSHSPNQMNKGPMSFFEGFSELFAMLVTGVEENVDDVENYAGVMVSLNSAPNTGEIVEGAFANALYYIYRYYVLGGATLSPSVNGVWPTRQPWMNDHAMHEKFLAAIWRPLRALRKGNAPNISDFVDAMRTTVTTDWHLVLPHLHRWNIARRSPTITSIAPASAAAGDTVTIEGSEFAHDRTVVLVGGVAAQTVRVLSATNLEFVVPPAAAGAGAVDITVATNAWDGKTGSYVPVGGATRTAGFTYT